MREDVLGEGEHRVHVEMLGGRIPEVGLGRRNALPQPVALALVLARLQHPIPEQVSAGSAGLGHGRTTRRIAGGLSKP